MRRLRPGSVHLALLVGVAILLSASAASGLERGATRAQFVKGADEVCREHYRDSAPYARRGEQLLKDRQFRRAASKFLRAIDILRGIRQVRAVPHPAADDARIDEWIDGELESLTLAAGAWKAVQERRFERADRLFRKARRVHRRAHRPVRSFDFEHCT